MGGAEGKGGHRIDEQLLALLAHHADAGTPCVLATVVRTQSPTSAHPGDKAVIAADGSLSGWIGGSCAEPLVRREAMQAISDGLPRLVRIIPSGEVQESRTPNQLTVATTCPSGGALDIFIDPQVPRPLLIVIGASPAAAALVRLGGIVGFRTCAVDPGAGDPDRPAADLMITRLDLAELAGRHDSWAVVATMGHYDEDALAAVLALPEADIALVASARRSEAVLENLRGRGISEGQLARVRAPAGERRAGSQEEIALHALAEIVTRRRERLAAEHAPAPATMATFAVDPVCGMTVDVATATRRAAYGGQEFVFCCAGCADRFAANPESFVRTRSL